MPVACAPGKVMMKDQKQPPVRRLVYVLLATISLAFMAGRILSAPATLSDNDNSRWATVRALTDDGTYVVGHRDYGPTPGQYRDRGIITEEGWTTIDKVLHPETHKFYSSKPPFLSTCAAGEYWLIRKFLGWSIVEQRTSIERVVLMTFNAIPFLFFLILLARLVEWMGQTDWGKLFVMAAACFATYLTPFAVTFNNHSVAACCALFTIYPTLRIWYRADCRSRYYVLAGFFAGCTACIELPALSMLMLLLPLLSLRSVLRTALCFVPAAAVPVAAFFWTNFLAIGQLRPAYSEFGEAWYEFSGSYWQQPTPGEARHGIDWAGLYEGKVAYTFNLLVGHHGWFSLTPIWLLALAGIVFCLWPRSVETVDPCTTFPKLEPKISRPPRLVAGMTLVLSIVVVTFYVFMSSNYGGWTSGLRWFIWLTPFWLLSLLSICDRLANSHTGRGVAYVLLAFSVLSVGYASSNPWQHPWLYNFLDWQGRIIY
jgi:hypothetical protein